MSKLIPKELYVDDDNDSYRESKAGKQLCMIQVFTGRRKQKENDETHKPAEQSCSSSQITRITHSGVRSSRYIRSKKKLLANKAF